MLSAKNYRASYKAMIPDLDTFGMYLAFLEANSYGRKTNREHGPGGCRRLQHPSAHLTGTDRHTYIKKTFCGIEALQ